MKEESRKREATALFNKGEALTLTERMRLQMIAPAAYEQLKNRTDNWQNRSVDELNEQTRQGQLQRARTASKNGFVGRI